MKSCLGMLALIALVHAADNTADMGKYPGYAGNINVSGTVAVAQASAGTLELTFDLAGLPPNTTSGLHIHSGSSCAEDPLVGGHFWKNATVNASDPWTTTYTSDTNGVAAGSFQVSCGYSLEEVQAHTIVVHIPDYKAACGVIATPAAGTTAPSVTPATTTTTAPTTTPATITTTAPSVTPATTTAAPTRSEPLVCVQDCPCIMALGDDYVVNDLCGCTQSCDNSTCTAPELAEIQALKDGVCAECQSCKGAAVCFEQDACDVFDSATKTWAGLFTPCNVNQSTGHGAIECTPCYGGGCDGSGGDIANPCVDCDPAAICFSPNWGCTAFDNASQTWSGDYVGCNVNASMGTGAMDCVPDCIAFDGCPEVTEPPTKMSPTLPPRGDVSGASTASVSVLALGLAVLLV